MSTPFIGDTTSDTTSTTHAHEEHTMKAITRDRFGTIDVLEFHDICGKVVITVGSSPSEAPR